MGQVMRLLQLQWMMLALLFMLIPAAACRGEQSSETMPYTVRELVSGRDIVWGMAFIDASTLVFTEKSGEIDLLDLATSTVTSLHGGPAVAAAGQGGLLDVAVHPDYPGVPYLYFTYVKAVVSQGATTLGRARLEGDRLTEWRDLLVTRSTSPTGRHFGSRIAFDDQGHLFFSVGDRGVRSTGQDLASHAGTIIRLNLDGTVPADNPFVGRPQALPEIYSFGHRNPQGLAYDQAAGRLWAIEHGPRGGDELNRILPGRNYGWPIISHGKEYWGPVAVGEATTKAGMEDPVKVYIPSIAPSSLLLYTGDAFPGWKGNLLAGALAMTHLNRIVLDENGLAVGEERLLQELDERLRQVIQGPDGSLYISTDSGRILQLLPR